MVDNYFVLVRITRYLWAGNAYAWGACMGRGKTKNEYVACLVPDRPWMKEDEPTTESR